MSSSERATAAPLAADPVAWRPAAAWPRLFDVLDRADGGPVPAAHRPAGARPPTAPAGTRTRRRPHRAAALGPAGADGAPGPGCGPRCRRGGPLPVAAPGRLAAPWSAGRPSGVPVRGASTWPGARPSARRRPAAARAARTPAARPGRRPAPPGRAVGRRRRRRVPRLGRPARPAPASRRPTVPWCCARCPAPPRSVPGDSPQTSVQPAAPSPAAVLTSPRSGSGRTAVDAAGPSWSSGRPRRKTEWTRLNAPGPPAGPRRSPGPVSPTGLVRARGDPLSCPARGSPAPARRSRPPSSSRSSFP